VANGISVGGIGVVVASGKVDVEIENVEVGKASVCGALKPQPNASANPMKNDSRQVKRLMTINNFMILLYVRVRETSNTLSEEIDGKVKASLKNAV